MFRSGVIISLLVVLAALAYRRIAAQSGVDGDEVELLRRMGDELMRLEHGARAHAASARVALGYNANLDGVANATSVLDVFLRQALGDGEFAAATALGAARDHAKLTSARELAECFVHFFAAGAAAERFMERELFDRLVGVVQSDAQTRLSPGGNAALMANRVAALGGTALLGGPVGAALRPLLLARVEPVAAAGSNDDEYHLILEYRSGATFGGARAPRANRFIVHSDERNARVDGLELFHRALRRFAPSVVVVAGLHLLQEQPPTQRSARLVDVRRQLCGVPHAVALHFEFASIGEKRFVRELALALLSDVDSIGMNEQELADLYVALGGSSHSAAAVAAGELAPVKRAIAHLFAAADELARRVDETSARLCAARSLTRVHFHFLSVRCSVVFCLASPLSVFLK